MPEWVGVVFLFCLVAIMIYLIVKLVREMDNTWKIVSEGIYERVEYGSHVSERRSGAMVHTTHYYRVKDTIIHFADGTSCVLIGLHNIPFPKGTKIKVRRNLNSQYAIEKIDDKKPAC